MRNTIQSTLFVMLGAAAIIGTTACDKKADPVKPSAMATPPAATPPAATPPAATPPAADAVATAPSADAGKAIYGKVCIACHSVDGTKLVGPTMKGMYGREAKGTKGESYTLDDAGITTSIKEPNKNIAEGYPPAMVLPAPLSDGDIKSVIAYLKTLK